MSTIPASQIVEVLPGVLSAGGTALETLGLALDNNTRIPVGEVLSFPDGPSVTSYFGGGSHEDQIANGGANLGKGYFGGFTNCTQTPAALLFTQYNPDSVAAWLRGGPIDQLSIPQLQGLSGSLTIVLDGYTYNNGTVNLSAATSYSAAAAIIQTALNASLPAACTFTGSIATGTASFTASIEGNVMYVTAVASGVLWAGSIVAGTGVASGTQIGQQLTGTTGGIGTYSVNKTQVIASEAMTTSYGTLTVTAVSSGTLSIGQTITEASAGTQITALNSGTGLTGTYIVNNSQTVVSATLHATGSAITVAFDSVSGGLLITAGSRGSQSTSTYATGTLAAGIFLTQLTGAVLSQGAAPAQPSLFMEALVQTTQNWVSFWTTFDPDDGSGSLQKQLFAGWVNSTTDRYMYIAIDTDPSPTLSADATSSFGQWLITNEVSGTFPMWHPAAAEYNYAAFVAGMVASINYNATDGRITLAFKGQDGLVASVTSAGVASNLIANGYNFYGAYATANEQFVFLQKGTISGEFEWADSYVNQIVLNNAFQLAFMVLLTEVNSIPYNQPGYAMVEGAMADPIAMGLNSGIIRAGVTLSALQTEIINERAGANVAPTVTQQGWVIVLQPASPQVRQARQSPVIYFFYTDGESIQQIVLNSIDVQ
jgi:hypothetical protein